MLAGARRDRRQRVLARRRDRRAADVRGHEVDRDLALGHARHLRALVEADHRRVVELSFETLERRDRRGRARREIRAIDQQRLVGREEAPVVLEHAELVGVDLGVGRVDVGDVGAAAGERAVGEVVVHAARVVVQAVAGAQAGPAVGAVHHLVAEHESQLGMRGEIGDAADAQRGGARLGHRQRVAVVEAERPASARRPRAASTSASGRSADLVAQDLLRQRPGVLGVDVDGAGLERAEDDLGAAELAAVLDGQRRAAHQRGDHLAQDHRLGEALRRDDDGPAGRLAAARSADEARQQRAPQRRVHPAPLGRRGGGRRCEPPLPVARNAVTNGSAGDAASVAIGPC